MCHVMKLESYLAQIESIRSDLWAMGNEALHNHTSVPDVWYEKQTELLKTIKNARAYCRRHNMEYPRGF